MSEEQSGLWPRSRQEKLQVLRELPAGFLFVGGAYALVILLGALLGY